jgi:hypothetical protein
MSYTDMGTVGATTDGFIVFENADRHNGWCCLVSNVADHASAFAGRAKADKAFPSTTSLS